jgi:type IV secretion system protein VirB10
VGQQITRKNLNIQPTLVIRPGYRFNVLVTRDLVLPVYGQEGQPP